MPAPVEYHPCPTDSLLAEAARYATGRQGAPAAADQKPPGGDGRWLLDAARPEDHPLYPVFMAAIDQAMYGKGERHGGAATSFLKQPWVHYVRMHGRGFATGQAAKKLEEAAATRQGVTFEQEVLGAIVYAAMAILKERGDV